MRRVTSKMTDETLKPRIFRRTRRGLSSDVEPIVLEYDSGRRRDDDSQDDGGERYSRDLKDVQRLEADVVRIARRASSAATRGLDTYERERSKSAKEKKDGAIEDFPHNAAKAASESLKEASELPLDIADSLEGHNYRKRMRLGLRRASKVLRVFRLD